MPKIICFHCKREYTTKEKYSDHKIYCDVIHNPQEQPTYSLKDISIMMSALIKKVDKLEKEQKEMKKELKSVNRKKESVLSILNKTYPLNENLYKFLEKFLNEINEDWIDKIIDESINTNLVSYLLKHIEKRKKENEKFIPPFYYCNIKQEIYVYTHEWVLFQAKTLTDFVDKIQSKLIIIYFEWKKNKENKVKNMDEISQKMMLKISKLNDEKFKLRKMLYVLKDQNGITI